MSFLSFKDLSQIYVYVIMDFCFYFFRWSQNYVFEHIFFWVHDCESLIIISNEVKRFDIIYINSQKFTIQVWFNWLLLKFFVTFKLNDLCFLFLVIYFYHSNYYYMKIKISVSIIEFLFFKKDKTHPNIPRKNS